ncbi:MAG: hypothetical protein JST40_05965 [Armatimonadetes bacterium]|nr:hypothetical protein [Armatimonadota bacterium]
MIPFKRAPVTWSLIGLMGLTFLMTFAGAASIVLRLTFVPSEALSHPWTFVTYAVAVLSGGNGFFWVLMALLWLYQIGTQLEGQLTSTSYAILFGIFTLLGSIGVFALSGIAQGGILAGGLVPVSGITTVWCARNRSGQVMFFGIIPIPTPVLAAVTASIAFFSVGSMHPILGIAGALPAALGWFWGLGKLPMPSVRGRTFYADKRIDKETLKREEKRQNDYFEKVREKETERAERERLRKLFESSLEDDQK